MCIFILSLIVSDLPSNPGLKVGLLSLQKGVKTSRSKAICLSGTMEHAGSSMKDKYVHFCPKFSIICNFLRQMFPFIRCLLKSTFGQFNFQQTLQLFMHPCMYIPLSEHIVQVWNNIHACPLMTEYVSKRKVPIG